MTLCTVKAMTTGEPWIGQERTIMTKTAEARKRLMEEIQDLSDQEVKLLADFAAFIKEREEWLATMEVLRNPELAQAIRDSRSAWSQGKRAQSVSLDSLKRPSR